MIIGGMIMVFGGTIMTKRRDDYDNRRDELILISESGTPVLCERKTKSLKMSEKKLSETKNLTNLQNIINENGHFIKSVYS